MRNNRFKAERLGGLLKPNEHILLMCWAIECVDHICPLVPIEISDLIKQTLDIAKHWTLGNASVKDARNAAIVMNKLARVTTNLADKYAIKAAGHAVATAHMADHAVVASKYALKAFEGINNSLLPESNWQVEKLPFKIKYFMVKILLDKDKTSLI